MQDENWDDLRIVLSVARTDSFAGAARQLGVNESTVARRLQQAENRLGAQLFHRNNGKLVPTDAGQILVGHAEAIELQAQSAHSKISGLDQKAAGTVRVTAVPLLTNRILAPALGPLLAAHPDLQIDLIADPRDFSLNKREADIALRFARPQSDMRAVSWRIATLDYALYVAIGADPDALPYIGYEEAMRDLPQSRWLASETVRKGHSNSAVCVNDGETLLNCIAAGLGKSLLPVIIGNRNDTLVRVPASTKSVSRELWLMVHPSLRDLVRIKTTITWIKDVISEAARPDSLFGSSGSQSGYA